MFLWLLVSSWGPLLPLSFLTSSHYLPHSWMSFRPVPVSLLPTDYLPTYKPHTTTAELLIWLSTTLLLSRHYIILNDHVDCEEHLCDWHKLLWWVTWFCIYKRHPSLIVEDLITCINKLINTNWNKLCRNSMTNRKAKLSTHDGVNDSHIIVSLLISNQLNFTRALLT